MLEYVRWNARSGMSEYMSDRVSDRVSEYILGVCQNLCQIDCHMECQIPNVRTYVRYNIGWRGSKKVIGLDVYLKQSNNSAEKRFAKSSIWGANHLDKPKKAMDFRMLPERSSQDSACWTTSSAKALDGNCTSVGYECRRTILKTCFMSPSLAWWCHSCITLASGWWKILAALPDQLLGCQKPFIFGWTEAFGKPWFLKKIMATSS